MSAARWEPPDPLVTYRMADGSLIYGEYAFVSDPGYFEDADDPVEVIRETWSRVDSEVVAIHPPVCYCPACAPDEVES